ncbi:MAG: hypothetical protein WC749_11200 [Dehalococcoidia bacterium]
MQELQNYCGEFKSEIKPQDFSKDFLIKLMHEWVIVLNGVHELFHQTLKRDLGEQKAFDCRMAVWAKADELMTPKVSGAVRTYLKDTSKEALIKLMQTWGAGYARAAEDWYNTMKELVGDEQAHRYEMEVWCKTAETLNPALVKALGIEINNMVDFLKATQVIPDGALGGVYNPRYEILSKNHVIITFYHCRCLEWLEKNASPQRLVAVCHDTEVQAFRSYLKFFIPKATVTPLKLPPRKSKDEIPCQWELKLEG